MLELDAIQTIAVCGAGTMGAGIAQVAAAGGYNTILYDAQAAALKKAQASIKRAFDKRVEKGQWDAETAARNLELIQFESDPQHILADVIIEAIVENIPAKVGLFNMLAEVNHSDVIFASNTSSLSISEMAKQIMNPKRVAGMHFFNPAPQMALVEIVQGEDTDPKVVEILYSLTEKLGKIPVLVKDAPGFIVNRVARHYYLESMQIASEQVASLAEIDQLLESAGFKMGPFALMDLIGNDINLAVSQSLYDAFEKHPRFKPAPMQQEKVAAGHLGRKTKQGFYSY